MLRDLGNRIGLFLWVLPSAMGCGSQDTSSADKDAAVQLDGSSSEVPDASTLALPDEGTGGMADGSLLAGDTNAPFALDAGNLSDGSSTSAKRIAVSAYAPEIKIAENPPDSSSFQIGKGESFIIPDGTYVLTQRVTYTNPEGRSGETQERIKGTIRISNSPEGGLVHFELEEKVFGGPTKYIKVIENYTVKGNIFSLIRRSHHTGIQKSWGEVILTLGFERIENGFKLYTFKDTFLDLENSELGQMFVEGGYVEGERDYNLQYVADTYERLP